MYLLNIFTTNQFLSQQYQNKKNLEGDAGIDIFFPEDITFPPNKTTKIDFEISCEMKNTDFNKYVSYMLFPRSSIVKTPLRLANSIGLIDSQYRGHIMAFVDNTSNEEYSVKKGDRLFQLVGPTLDKITINLAESLSSTERGSGGFGSTGK